MPDQQVPAVVETKTTEQAPATPPAEVSKTETPAEHVVPFSRFNEVNEKLRKLEADAAKKAKADSEAEDRRLAEAAEWQKLADQRKAKVEELTPKAELADKLTELVLAQYSATLKDWPDQVKAMAPDDEADILSKLTWLEKAKPLAQELLGNKTPTPGNGRGPKPVGATNRQGGQKIDPVYDVKRNF